MAAVRMTPRVDRIAPLHSTDLASFHLVSRPPENKMKIRARVPRDWASQGLSK